MDLFGTSISNLIREQFPEQYREHGPFLVDFVREYYKWLETQNPSRDEWFVDKVSLVAVANKSANVVGKGTFFTTQFANGDSIAISKGEATTDYDIFTIRNISSNTFLTLVSSDLPNFTHANTRYATVSAKPNALFLTRNFPELHDIDETLDNFVIYFKEKYLQDFQFRTITDTRKLIKHSLDIYRSKGTERSIDLLYKAIFGKPAHNYYPGQDLFRLSSGIWYIPRYLELSLGSDNKALINQQILGISSGATAFVEEVVRCVMAGKIHDIAYISAINGTFQTDEKITLFNGALDMTKAPTITGSLNEIEIDVSGAGVGFAQNDIISVTSVTGRGAQAKVLTVSNTVGQLTFSLNDGGYGYIGANTHTYFSERILRIENATFNPAYYNFEYVPFLGTLTQPLATLHYENSNGAFAVGDHIYTWSAGTNIGEGEILLYTAETTTSGRLTVSILSGDLNEPAIYKVGNTVVANLSVVDGYTDLTVTAQVIGNYSNVSIVANGYSGAFEFGEEITQPGTAAVGIVTASAFNDTNTQLSVAISNSEGIFKNGFSIVGSNSGVTATVVKTLIDVGVVNSSADFYNFVNNYVYTSSMQGTVTTVSLGTGGSVVFSNTLIYPEDITISTDLISGHLSEVLSGTWNFTANPSATLASVIGTTLSFITLTIGKIDQMLSFNPGTDYNKIPIIKLHEPAIYAYNLPDTVVLNVSSVAGFENGELITQASTNARGKIKAISGDDLTVQNMRFYANNGFVQTTSAATRIVGTESGSITNVVFTDVHTQSARFSDDVTVDSTLTIGEGAISSVRVLDSGFGFLNGEQVTLSKDNNQAIGFALLETHGTGAGYYKSSDGFLSDIKKLSDGYYWQEYSYEVRSSVIGDFKKNLKQVVHVAGTKYFDALYYDTRNQTDCNVETTLTLSGSDRLRLRDGTSYLLLRNGVDKLILGYEH